MNVSLSDFKAQIRVRLGGPSVCNVDDAMLDAAINAMLRDYSKVKPYNGHSLFLTLQPYQEDYTLSETPELVLDVIPAAPTTASARAFGNEFRALELDLIAFQFSDLFVMQEKVSSYREMFEQIEWNYDSPPVLHISPSPVQALQAIVLVGDLQTLQTMKQADYEIAIAGTIYRTLEMWSLARDAQRVLEAPAALGTVRIEAGDRLFKHMEKYRTEFFNRLGWNRPYIGQG